MINNENTMKYITDRTCFNVLMNFKSAVIIDPKSFKIKTITKTLKKEIENCLNIQERFGITVPYVKVNQFNLDIEETVEEQPDNIMTIYSDCSIELCYEDCENTPELSAPSIVIGFFHSIGGSKEFIKSASAFDFKVYSPIKGYIQSNNTLYFPNKL